MFPSFSPLITFTRGAAAACALGAAFSSALAQDKKSANGEWPRWRGPKGDGICQETGLLKDWTVNPPPLLWSAKGFGSGMASVSVYQGKIYTMGSREKVSLICASADDGTIKWSTPIANADDPNCTPTVDSSSGLVFALTKKGDLICCDATTGKEVWKLKFSDEFGGKMMSGWGYSESPLVDGDLLICTPGGDEAVMAALNKKTGEVVWKTPMQKSGGAGYASPVISQGGGVKHYITLIGRGIIGVAARDGKLLWHYQRTANGTACIPTPLVSGDYVFTSTGYGDGGSALLKLKSDGSGGVTAEEIYYRKSEELQNHHGGMVMMGDYIYMGHGHNKGLPVCLEWKTGKVQWGPEPGPGKDSAALLIADGNLYFRYQDGVMALIEANPKKRVDHGSFKIATKAGESWPHPVIAGKKLYLRDQDHLHCYDLSAK